MFFPVSDRFYEREKEREKKERKRKTTRKRGRERGRKKAKKGEYSTLSICLNLTFFLSKKNLGCIHQNLESFIVKMKAFLS